MMRIGRLLQQKKGTIALVIVAVTLWCFFLANAQQSFDHTVSAPEETGTLSLLENGKTYEAYAAVPAERIQAIGLHVEHSSDWEGTLFVSLYREEKLWQSWETDAGSSDADGLLVLTLQSRIDAKEGESVRATIIPHITKGSISLRMDQTTPLLDVFVTNTRLRLIVMVIGTVLFAACLLCVLLRLPEKKIMTGVLLSLMLLYVPSCPPGMTPDDSAHFFRAYEVAMVSPVSSHVGKKEAGGNILPRAIYRFREADALFDMEDTTEVGFGNTALYSPASYLPQALGIRLTSFFTSHVRTVYQGGRIFSVIICFLLCAAALQLIPFGARILFLLMVFPMTLQEMCSISADGFTLALSFFFLSYILHLAYHKERVDRRDQIALTLSAVLLSQCKIVYVVLLLLLLLIPDDKFASVRSARLYKWGLMGAALLLNLLWLSVSAGFLVEFNPGVDSPAQVRYVLTHPFHYAAAVFRSIIRYGGTWIGWMIGSTLGSLSIVISPFVWIVLLILFVYEVINCDDCKTGRRKGDAFLLLFTFLLGSLLIFTSLYVQWTPLMYDHVSGVQGRYFTPLIGTLSSLIVMRSPRYRLPSDNVEDSWTAYSFGYLYLLVLLCNAIALNAVLQFFL